MGNPAGGRQEDLRTQLAARLRRPVVDSMWEELLEQGYVGDAESEACNGHDPVQYLTERVRRYEHAVGRTMPPPTSLTDRPSGAAATARIDALSAIYASWAQHDRDVEAFRCSNLVDHDTPEFRAYLDRSGPYPSYRLLTDDHVQPWVHAQHHAAASDGDGDRHVQELLARAAPGRRATSTLAYTVSHVVQRLTVDARGTLGELARLADELAERYRWHSAAAATFVLSGEAIPEVFVYDGSAQIRHGTTAATTRVTMTLDPFLTPDQVAAIYGRLRQRLARAAMLRASSPKHYRLAEYVGPKVRCYVDQPGRVARRGRPAQPGPTGLALYVDPVDGHSWSGLRVGWNRLQSADPQTQTWIYGADPHFIRDARQAVQRLLWPGWDWRDEA